MRAAERGAIWLRDRQDVANLIEEALALGWRLVHNTGLLAVYARGGRYLHVERHAGGRAEAWWSY